MVYGCHLAGYKRETSRSRAGGRVWANECGPTPRCSLFAAITQHRSSSILSSRPTSTSSGCVRKIATNDLVMACGARLQYPALDRARRTDARRRADPVSGAAPTAQDGNAGLRRPVVKAAACCPSSSQPPARPSRASPRSTPARRHLTPPALGPRVGLFAAPEVRSLSQSGNPPTAALRGSGTDVGEVHGPISEQR